MADLQDERDAALAEAGRLRQQLEEAEAAAAALRRELADLAKRMEALQVLFDYVYYMIAVFPCSAFPVFERGSHRILAQDVVGES